MSHFKLRTDLTKQFLKITLYRIELTIDCKWGKKGDLGGYVEKESNLQDDAWVCGDALVYGDARVYGNALVYGNTHVCGDAQVCGNARVYDNALVCGDALVHDNALVYGDARVYGNAHVCGNVRVYGNAQVYGNARVYGNAQVYGIAVVYGNALVYGNAAVYGNASVYGDARVHGNAVVHGNACVYGNALVYGDAKIEKYNQCVVITNQKNTITLIPNLIIIGCKAWKNLQEFEATYKQIGKDNNYTEDEAEMTAELVRAVMKRMPPIQTSIQIEHNGQKFEIDLEKAKELGIIK